MAWGPLPPRGTVFTSAHTPGAGSSASGLLTSQPSPPGNVPVVILSKGLCVTLHLWWKAGYYISGDVGVPESCGQGCPGRGTHLWDCSFGQKGLHLLGLGWGSGVPEDSRWGEVR